MNEFVIYLVILMAGLAHDYFIRYQARHAQASALQAQAAQLHAELANSRLNALRTQLNPHFLFNTLNAVSSLVERDPRGARRMIARLSDLLRDTLEGKDLEVPLQRELVFVRRYIDIMQTRFQGRLETTENIAPDTLDAMVPNLILQPLVENAIKHGIEKLDGVGRISIQAQRSGETLMLSVVDNGTAEPNTRLQEDPAGGGLGLRNTKARLAQSYGDQQSLTLRSNAGGGVVAQVVLPFHKAKMIA
jgi:LytS/YehU family sensor histidine kinase